jgi:myo-inositol 2-dehydrogenase/D-chiro-inositol 1-dehydrogenase|nr:inositol 2-dehydrogenase [Methylobacterium sp. 2A]
MRVAILGAGRIGRIHGANAAGRHGLSLVAVSDPDPAAAASLADATGAEVRDIAEAVAGDDVDAVLICTPTATHADLIERAARAGKAVFCEKPIDLSAERIVRCLEVVRSAGVPLMIGFNRRFDPHFAALRRRLAEGAIGEVEIVTVISRDSAPPPAGYVVASGGIFRDMMIHDLDMARFLLDGEPAVEVHAMGSALVDPAIGEAGDVDTAAVILKTARGRIVQISNSRRASYGYDQRIEVHGARGMLRAGNIHTSTVETASAAGFLSDPLQNFFLERYAEAYRAELAAFIEAVQAGVAPSPSGEDGLAAQRLADAATLSWQKGQPVRL